MTTTEKTLLKTPDLGDYGLRIEDFWDYENTNDFYITEFEGDKEEFIERYEDSDKFNEWVEDTEYMYREDDWDNFKWELKEILDKTRIKEGFLEIKNGGWRGQRGMTPNCFEITPSNIISKIIGEMDASFEVRKEGHQLSFIRYSHDEPTGARILLHSEKKFNKIQKEIFED
jgi:hypothetical protein